MERPQQQQLPLASGLTAAELAKYERDGWVIKRNVFAKEECEELTRYMTAVHDSGAPDFPGAAERNKASFPGKETADQRAADIWNGWGQPHLYDETIKTWMLDQRLRAPLCDVMGGDEPEGIKSYWWFKVQEGFTNTHCDGTALPKCTAVWIPMVDVDGGGEVGTLALQTGSHRGRRNHHGDGISTGVQQKGRVTTHSADGAILGPLVKEIYAENEANGCELVKIVANAGDILIFDGHVFHHAVYPESGDKEGFRQVLACHYVPAGYRHWPHILWERIDFNGTPRWSDGTDVESEAACVNARLPAHPGMPHLRQPFRPSIFPARREGLRLCSTAQVEDMDRLGYTVLRNQLSEAELAPIRKAVDELEARHWPESGPAQSAGVGNNSDASAITFTQGLAADSSLLRSFCGGELFQDLCWDCLHVDTAWLFNEQAVYKKPGHAGRIFPFHQDNGYAFMEPLQVLTCWVALSDAPEAAGCPRVIPKLHRRGPMEHKWDHEHNGLTIPGLREDDAVALPLQAGDIALFWSLTPHASGPNLTDGVRKGYIVQFAADGWDAQIWQRGAEQRTPGSAGPEVGHPMPRGELHDSGLGAQQPGRQWVVLKDGEGVPPPPLPLPLPVADAARL
jgi:ectoine hydroxylase-related dioxygenase (phytanoyl-CoA dioxygenase family)